MLELIVLDNEIRQNIKILKLQKIFKLNGVDSGLLILKTDDIRNYTIKLLLRYLIGFRF